MNKPTSKNNTVQVADLKRIHETFKAAGMYAEHKRLAEKEAGLARYVLNAAYYIGKWIHQYEMTPEAIDSIRMEIGIRMLVAIEALQQAHDAHWQNRTIDPANAATDLSPLTTDNDKENDDGLVNIR